MEYQQFTLPNGIRVIHRYTDSYVSHCGMIINTGSRDEKDNEQGIAHFLEHVIFKGTKNRKAYHILSNMENVGGELNAYTSKEDTFIFATFLHRYYERAVNIITDILFNSTFPEKEITKEREVVIDEINSYKDTPSELIFDDFEEQVFKGHPIGRNILGKPANIRKINRKKITHFIDRTYNTDQMVFCSVGKIPVEKLKKYLEKHLEGIKPNNRKYTRKPINGYAPETFTMNKKTYQTHCLIGNRAYSSSDKKKNILVLLNNILGGPGLNSRLNLGIREKYGFCYNIESNYTGYSDTGIFSMYLGTAKGFADKTIELALTELKKLRETKLGVLQLKRAKQQLIGQLAIYYEINSNELLSIGKSFLTHGKVDTLEQVNKKIEAISANELIEVANEVFDPGELSMLIYRAR